LANVAPPDTTVPLLVVGQVGSDAALVPATVQRITHCAFNAGAIGFTICPTLYATLGTNAAIAA
jgi:hypothetical protein